MKLATSSSSTKSCPSSPFPQKKMLQQQQQKSITFYKLMTESLQDFDTDPCCDGDIICFLDLSSADLWHKTQFRLSFCKARRITELKLEK